MLIRKSSSGEFQILNLKKNRKNVYCSFKKIELFWIICFILHGNIPIRTRIITKINVDVTGFKDITAVVYVAG